MTYLNPSHHTLWFKWKVCPHLLLIFNVLPVFSNRHFVIAHFPKLEVLDDKKIEDDERSEAKRIYGRKVSPRRGSVNTNREEVTLMGYLPFVMYFLYNELYCFYMYLREKGNASCMWGTLLAHLSRRLKWAFLIKICPSLSSLSS